MKDGGYYAIWGRELHRWLAVSNPRWPWVAGLDGLVYPEAMARDIGVDGYPCRSNHEAVEIVKALREGDEAKADKIWLLHLKMAPEPLKYRLEGDDLCRAREMWEKGRSMRRIAVVLGASPEAVRMALEELEEGRGAKEQPAP